mmetsp:Transcript_28042/g.78443  ORF Transcript_28042/g.78443 Transcript_28042/m.78443 type:complete len:221 (-) Transcript_28042:286-948(-)
MACSAQSFRRAMSSPCATARFEKLLGPCPKFIPTSARMAAVDWWVVPLEDSAESSSSSSSSTSDDSDAVLSAAGDARRLADLFAPPDLGVSTSMGMVLLSRTLSSPCIPSPSSSFPPSEERADFTVLRDFSVVASANQLPSPLVKSRASASSRRASFATSLPAPLYACAFWNTNSISPTKSTSLLYSSLLQRLSMLSNAMGCLTILEYPGASRSLTGCQK